MAKSTVPYRPGGFTTLAKALDYAAQSTAKVRFFDNTGSVITQHSYEELRISALKLAAYLHSLGLKRGSYVAMIAETRVEFNILFFACQYAGFVPCPLPFTILVAGREAYEKKLLQFLKILKPALLVGPASIETITAGVGQSCHVPTSSYEALSKIANDTPMLQSYQDTWLGVNDLAYVQFSSGSTAEPGGLLITQKAVMANLNAVATDGIGVIAEEQTFSWLPFDYDMGLVSFVLSPVNTQSNADFISPATFMARPELWLELMSACRSTLTFAPVFAYGLALQKRDPNKILNLSALRVAGIGGDMIHADTLRNFAQAMQDTGFRFDAFSPGYGLAEAVMAISLTRPETPPFIQHFSGAGHTQELVSCGQVLPGYDITVKHETDSFSVAHRVGEIWVKGPSIVTESLNAAEKIKQDKNGFIATGDLGFLHEGHLFITCRVKDMIIIRGRNIWAQDIEWAIADCDERLHNHSIAAIGVTQNNEENLVVLVQNSDFDNIVRAELQEKMEQTVNQSFGVKVQMVWTQKDQLSTTTAGKLARAQIKQNYLDGTLKLLTT